MLGTVDRNLWRRALKEGPPVAGDTLDYVTDFEREYDLHYEPGGWERA